MKNLAFSLVLAVPALGLSTTYSFDIKPGSSQGTNSKVSQITDLKGSYNDATDRLTFYANFVKPNSKTGLGVDGFHLVLSPGPNPKGYADELAIFYFDATSKNNPKLNVFAYNGQNANTSYSNPNDRILSSVASKKNINSLTSKTEGDGSVTLGFDINASVIQNHKPGNKTWTGAEFAQQVGLWFHSYNSSYFSYDSKGYIKSLTHGYEGYVDDGGVKTAVPEPATIAMLALGLAGVARRRKKA